MMESGEKCTKQVYFHIKMHFYTLSDTISRPFVKRSYIP